MADSRTLTALDSVRRQIRRARKAGMRTVEGSDATEHLDRLAAEIARQTELVSNGSSVDPAWLRDTIRWVATWVPAADLNLLGALGAVARATASRE